MIIKISILKEMTFLIVKTKLVTECRRRMGRSWMELEFQDDTEHIGVGHIEASALWEDPSFVLPLKIGDSQIKLLPLPCRLKAEPDDRRARFSFERSCELHVGFLLPVVMTLLR